MFFPRRGAGGGAARRFRFGVSTGEHSAGNQPAPTGVGIPDGLREVLSCPTGAVLYGLEARHREMKEQGIKTVAVPDGRMKVHSRAYALWTRIVALSALRFPQIAPLLPSRRYPRPAALPAFSARRAR